MTETYPAVETRSVVVHGAGHRVQLIRRSDEPGPWLVFLHEGLGSIAQWRSFPTELASAAGMNAMVYDRRNHGGSDVLSAPRGRNYHTEESDILEALLDELAMDRVVTYGHSDGATIALLHAARHPERTVAVISEAGHVVAEATARDGIERTQQQYRAGGLREALERHHGDRTDAMFNAWADTWLLPEFEDWSIVETLSAVRAPVLVLQGGADGYASAAHVDWIAAAVGGPAHTWLLPGVGHAPHRDAPAEVIANVVGFLARSA